MTEIQGINFNNMNLPANGATAQTGENTGLSLFGNGIIGGTEDSIEDNSAAKKTIELQAQDLIRLAKNLKEDSSATMKKLIDNKMKALKQLAEMSGVDVNEVFSEVMANMSRSDQKKISKTLKVEISKVRKQDPEQEAPEVQEQSSNLFAGFAGLSETTQVQSFAPSTSSTPRIKLSQEFREKAKGIAERVNCDYKDLLGVMNCESGLNSKARNSKGGATGLIQFMPATARMLGTTTDELYKMSPEKQLDYVEKFLVKVKSMTKVGNRKLSAGDLYTLVFLPAKVNSDVLCAAGSKEYSWNKGLDGDKKGFITKADLSKRVARHHIDESKVFA